MHSIAEVELVAMALYSEHRTSMLRRVRPHDTVAKLVSSFIHIGLWAELAPAQRLEWRRRAVTLLLEGRQQRDHNPDLS